VCLTSNLTGQITLSTQAEVDAWDQSITALTEDLTIRGTDITNIDALSNLEEVLSILEIINNPELTNIDGLSGLTNVSGELQIITNRLITDIDGLSNLTDVTGEINLQSNATLSSIDGFLGLTDFAGMLAIQFNDALLNIDGLSNLENVSGTISIRENDGLLNVNGFSNLDDFTGRIFITRNEVLTNVDGFSNLTNLSGSLDINGNISLVNLNAISSLTDISGALTIQNNTAISDFTVLSNLTDISGTLSLTNLAALLNLDMFSNLTDICGRLSISRNENLLDIDGLLGFSTLNGEIRISDNPSLTNINGLSNLTNVLGELIIHSNTSLENIDPLSGLTDVEGTIVIDDNDALPDIEALAGFSDISGELIIVDNDGIINVDEFSSLTELTGTIRIRENVSLENIDGFLGLTDVIGELDIHANHSLTNLNGLASLTNVSGTLTIRDNSGLINIDNLIGLNNVNGRLNLYENDGLVNIDGFSGLSMLDGALYITNNHGLLDIDGFLSLQLLNGDIIISNNNSLPNIDGLSGISELTRDGRIQIIANAILPNIDGLSNLVSLEGDINIFENPILTNIDGLLGLTEISRTTALTIFGNQSLTNIDGFRNLVDIKRHLSILENNALTNLDGLSGVESISNVGHLRIERNSSLTNIDGLSSIRSTSNSTRITIHDNDLLTNLDGLFAIEQMNGRIIVTDNALMSSCCSLQSLIEANDLLDFTIETNLDGCNSPEEILDVCSLVLNYDQYRPCEGLDNGSINFFASDFHSIPFTYEWEEITSGQTGSGVSYNDNFSIDNLAAGTYDVRVSLPNGASQTADNIVLDPILGSIFEITTLTSTNSTNGTLSGSLYLEYFGGTAPYGLTWTGAASGSRMDIEDNFFTIFGLGPGEYTLQLTDANGQSKLVDITLLDEMIPSFPCSEALDIIILNDVSGSVDSTEYSESQTFFVDFLRAANIGQGSDESQATIVEWSNSNQQSIRVPLTGQMQEIESYEGMTRAYDMGTFPHQAMEFGREYIENNGRAEVEKVFILSTDGSPSSSLIALADEFKAEGYHIVTIAFDGAFIRSTIRDILTQVASIPLLAPGAAAYSDLDSNLADNIVNLYLCPLNPGSSNSVYFNRDGAISIDSIQASCPVSDFAELTFSVAAQKELSIPAGMSVMFYHNDPLLFGATPILDFVLPCAIPAGSSDTYTVNLPINNASKIYALLNDDGRKLPPLNFPITEIQEVAYSNNVDTISVCVDSQATLQALKYTTTPTPICDSLIMYTIDVCNIGTVDATSVVVIDNPPLEATLLKSTVNVNGCSTDNNESYDIPSDCCVSISLTYDASDMASGYYGIQNVELDGPAGQEYISYDGSLSSAEDVTIEDGVINCPSTDIWITKEVSDEEICEDGFLVYTYTIHNETSAVIHDARFIDVLPDPMEWVYKPYFLNGLGIGTQELSGTSADFIIDEIPADTIASFKIDAYTGDWEMDGVVSRPAILENVIDLEDGGTQILVSNEVSTMVFAQGTDQSSPCDSISTSNILESEDLSIIEVFPNPTGGTIQIANLTKPVKYKLFNSTGQLYKSGEYIQGELDIQYEGINLLQISIDDKMKVFKIIRIGAYR
jgi:uncharacterized repeat protein (TIGR01451 family)